VYIYSVYKLLLISGNLRKKRKSRIFLSFELGREDITGKRHKERKAEAKASEEREREESQI